MVAALLVSTRDKPRPPQLPPRLIAHGTATSRAGAEVTGWVSLPMPGHTPNLAQPEGKSHWRIHTGTSLCAASVPLQGCLSLQQGSG